jgi:hypothetical protein
MKINLDKIHQRSNEKLQKKDDSIGKRTSSLLPVQRAPIHSHRKHTSVPKKNVTDNGTTETQQTMTSEPWMQ